MQYRHLITWFSFLFIAIAASAQQGGWPVTVKTTAGTEVKLYEPMPESYSGNLLKIRAAVSMVPESGTEPVFGVLWADVTTRLEGSSAIAWQNVSVTNIRFPGESDKAELSQLQAAIEAIPGSRQVSMSQSELQAKLKAGSTEVKLAQDLGTNPPAIIYKKNRSILVLIDGQPDLQTNTEWGVEQVVNTPFTIVRNNSRFYLYGDKKWYTAGSITGPWSVTGQVPASLSKMDRDVREKDTTQASGSDVAEIVVSTTPAELIQSNGEANFSPLQGTNLLYMTNTANDVFMDINSQQYYVLMSGRWYTSRGLAGNWTYTSPESLPADFARIPEASAKENVLASVAGTGAANESLMDAQMPQTAKVDRKNATASVTYDGDPRFENIEGTSLQYAVNSPGSVLYEGRKYYYVENGVWFESDRANGPWRVATQRPAGVENIPPSYPVYNVKYVYIYDATPDYVYMGYTPGYLGTYIYGPTIVYGTGYYYRPWRGRYYYPRPVTWGFNVRYQPWSSWGFSIGINTGWFYSDFGYYGRGACWGGWWGPAVYRPPYYRVYNGYGRYNNGYNNYAVINRRNNVYRYRRDVVTYEQPRYASNRGVYRNGQPARTNNGRYNNTYNNNNNVPAQRPNPGNTGNRPVTRDYSPRNNRVDNGYGNGNNRGTVNGGFPSRQEGGMQRPSVNNGQARPDLGRSMEGTPSRPENGGMQRPAATTGQSRPDLRGNIEGVPSRPDYGNMQRTTPSAQPRPDLRRSMDAGAPSGATGREYRAADPGVNMNRPNNSPERAERSQEARSQPRQFQNVQPDRAPRQQQERPVRESGGNGGNQRGVERPATRRGG